MCILGATDSEHALMQRLFSKYNLKVRPARTPEERVVVRVGMVLSSFGGLVRHTTSTQKWSKQQAAMFFKILEQLKDTDNVFILYHSSKLQYS